MPRSTRGFGCGCRDEVQREEERGQCVKSDQRKIKAWLTRRLYFHAHPGLSCWRGSRLWQRGQLGVCGGDWSSVPWRWDGHGLDQGETSETSRKGWHLCLTIKQLVSSNKPSDLRIYLSLKMHASFFRLEEGSAGPKPVAFHFSKGITCLCKPHRSCFHTDLLKFPGVTCLL